MRIIKTTCVLYGLHIGRNSGLHPYYGMVKDYKSLLYNGETIVDMMNIKDSSIISMLLSIFRIYIFPMYPQTQGHLMGLHFT